MHSSIKTTDNIYAVLSENEVIEGIARLGENKKGGNEESIYLIALYFFNRLDSKSTLVYISQDRGQDLN